jgi:cobalamin biosynthesis protein CobT
LEVYGPVKRRLEHLLRKQSRSFLAGDRLEGTELDQGNLYQLALAKKISNYEPRIFQQKIERYTLRDTAVGLMVDSSGSMGGHRAALAQKTAFALGECLAAAKVHFGMWSFTTSDFDTGYDRFSEASAEDQALYSRWGDLRIMVAKDFKDKWETTKHNVCSMFDHTAHNLDSEAVLYAGQQLLAQRHSRKVLFVLSDGDPCSGEDGRAKKEDFPENYVQGRQDKHLHEVIRALRAQGVEVVGVGICTSAVNVFYKPTAVVVHDARELPKVVLEQMKFLLLQERS